jgi:osmoprotectant transport system ATP-binding protein
MLALTGVSKRYGDLEVLRPTDLVVGPGETIVLIGPSGCGKSTLLRLMIGLIRPDTGSVRFEDREVNPQSAMELRRHMGYVIQDGGLFPHLTACANITLMARYLGWGTERIEKRLGELAGLTRFPLEALDRYPAQVSGGQRQRIGLMRALMLDPDLLLLDEPLGALDPLVRADLQTDLLMIFQTLKKTIVLVTHDLAEAAFFGGTIVLLRDGQIVQRGTLPELVEKPATPFVTQFIRAQRSLQGDGLA